VKGGGDGFGIGEVGGGVEKFEVGVFGGESEGFADVEDAKDVEVVGAGFVEGGGKALEAEGFDFVGEERGEKGIGGHVAVSFEDDLVVGKLIDGFEEVEGAHGVEGCADEHVAAAEMGLGGFIEDGN